MQKTGNRYESEHTKFMREWLGQHPEQTTEKLNGRKLWWDKLPKSLDELRRLRESRVAQKSYAYY